MSGRITISALLLAANGASAQSVSGTLAAPPNTPPPSGVIMMLVDSLGRTVAQRLSSGSGSFLLQAPGAGVYTLKALRIGYRPTTSESFILGDGVAYKLDLALNSAAVELARTEVTTSRQCEAPRDSTTAAFTVWTEARKALLSSALARQDPYVMEIAKFERVHEIPGNLLVRERESAQRNSTVRPFVSIPLEQLDAHGYVTMDPSGTTYSAPDENVLLSEQFASTHCLRLQTPGTAEIAVAFEPVSDRREPDLRGAMVLDRRTLVLKRLDFSYVNVPEAVSTAGAGGSLHFRQLSSGGFIVDDWILNMPVLQQQTRMTSASMADLQRGAIQRNNVVTARAMQQTGGTVTFVQRGNDVIYAAPLPALAGRVAESTGAGIPHARIELPASMSAAEADARGQFLIERVRPARRNVIVSYPLLDTLMLPRVEREIDSRSGAPVVITVPERTQLIRRVCAAARDSLHGILRVTVRDSLGNAAAGVPVLAEWFEARGFTFDQGHPGSEHSVSTTTNEGGDLLLCGVPVGQGVYLTSSRGGLKYLGKGRIPEGEQLGWARIYLLHPGEERPK